MPWFWFFPVHVRFDFPRTKFSRVRNYRVHLNIASSILSRAPNYCAGPIIAIQIIASTFLLRQKRNNLVLAKKKWFTVYIQKHSLQFFLCYFRISRIMNAKKCWNSRGKTRAMEFHEYSMDFFFLSQEFFYIHSEKFLTFFFNAVFVFPE